MYLFQLTFFLKKNFYIKIKIIKVVGLEKLQGIKEVFFLYIVYYSHLHSFPIVLLYH